MARTATRTGPATSAPGDGSRTITLTPAQAHEDHQGGSGNEESSTAVVGVLKLRGKKGAPRVAWDEGVVDNEGCGKKKSKICCIYHKPRQFDESSSESDSDSDSDSSDSDAKSGKNDPHSQPQREASSGHCHHNHGHDTNAYEREGKGKHKAN
ncbi:hypothetical protein BDN72DRAFT_846199 [Pluteus cervinus]|uniref:Uncharacterized protein n=1 Tax=Pluteus cervinus TaxID=181527 RepID=A0ACD3AGX0_9AGAR|nr:hypothetical protein BDN72DRAFT_846199 [Pluteus cervinus]